jgi:hypothetical protein
MRLIAEYALVGMAGICLAAALLNSAWYFDESYPRSVPTLFSIPACAIGSYQCFAWAAVIHFHRIFQ